MDHKHFRFYLAGIILAGVIILYVFANLRRQEDRSELSLRERRANAAIPFDVPARRFAGIETLRKVQSKELIAEIEKVISQNGLYADVFVNRFTQQENEQHNIAVTLYNLFNKFYSTDPNDSQNSEDLQKLWEASPIGVWDADKDKLNSIASILPKFEPLRQAIRSQLRDSKTCFYYLFIRPDLKSAFSVASFVDTDASKHLSDYALLEEYAAAQALLSGNISAAAESLAYIFRIAQLASELANVGVRSDAAQIRLRAFDVMQRIVLDPKFDKPQMIVIRNMLAEQRAHWKPEQTVWFGDRAAGLALYHRLIQNNPENVLEPGEIQYLQDEKKWDLFPRSFLKYHETDAVFYLQSMQQILDVSTQPFAKRLDVLNKVNQDLIATEHTFDDKGIAREYFTAHLLLKDVDRLMRFFAQDESALNRSLTVILMSLGQQQADTLHDPFTDAPYEVRKVDGLLNVSGTGLPRPFRVPIFTDSAQ